MSSPLSRIAALLGLCLSLGLGLPGPGAQAQNLFSPAIRVNDGVITYYELEQRTRFVSLLRAPGDPRVVAREQLIDDRLREQAAARAGIVPSEADVLSGMEEFASRANLTRAEFVQALAGGGVEEQTFRDFVRAGLSWRLLVQSRFGARSNPSEAELDRALSSRGGGSNIRVLISEIIMPAPPPQAAAVQARAAEISRMTSEAEFSAAARRYSATPTRGSGGRLPWRDLSELPPPLQPLLLSLAPGEVTQPINLPNAVALFQLRAIEEAGYTPPPVSAVEYAMYFMPGGRSDDTLAKARVLASRVDRCDDLYGVAKGQPAEVLERVTQQPGQIPTDIAFELSKLDPGEVSTTLTRGNGQTLMFLMLCGRSTALPEAAGEAEGEQVDQRQELALGLRNQRLTTLAEGYLSQLRAEARIRDQ